MHIMPESLACPHLLAVLTPVPAWGREVWFELYLALKPLPRPKGLKPLVRWSSNSGNYDPAAVRDLWKSFCGSKVTLGRPLKFSQHNGWLARYGDVDRSALTKPALGAEYSRHTGILFGRPAPPFIKMGRRPGTSYLRC